MKINVLTNHSAPNSRAFNTPIAASADILKISGITVKFCFAITPKIFKCDAIFINSNFFRYFWKDRKQEIFQFLETLVNKKIKIFWFDTTDSTWVTQFEVLPYVNKFLKSHLLKDKNLYLKNFRTGRIFTDYFDDLYQADEKPENYPPASSEHLHKLAVSWTPCFEYYSENRYSFTRKLENKLKPYLINFSRPNLNIEFTPPTNSRMTDISARFGLSHSRPSVVAHRKAVADILTKRGVLSSRIPLEDYFHEMRNSKISISPFGVGEFCYRDYETIICGAALIKPDMSHLDTWPDLYQNNISFIAHKWDLSDLNEKIDFLLDNEDLRIKIVTNAQNIYKNAVSKEGIRVFADKISDILG